MLFILLYLVNSRLNNIDSFCFIISLVNIHYVFWWKTKNVLVRSNFKTLIGTNKYDVWQT